MYVNCNQFEDRSITNPVSIHLIQIKDNLFDERSSNNLLNIQLLYYSLSIEIQTYN